MALDCLCVGKPSFAQMMPYLCSCALAVSLPNADEQIPRCHVMPRVDSRGTQGITNMTACGNHPGENGSKKTMTTAAPLATLTIIVRGLSRIKHGKLPYELYVKLIYDAGGHLAGEGLLP